MRLSTSLRTYSSQPEPFPSDAAALNALLADLGIDSPCTLKFGNLAPIEINVAQGASIPATHPLTEVLTSLIYHYAYARAWTGDPAASAIPSGSLAQVEADPRFVASLSAANHSRERWDPMWRVYKAELSGALSVEKRSVYFQVLPGSYTFTESPGRIPTIGDSVSVHVPKESNGVQRGFYFSFGETIASEFDDILLARFYFHATAEGVPNLLEWISGDLNRYRVPFRFKCLANPVLYDRRDPVVLYIAKRFVPLWLRLAASRRDELEKFLLPSHPLFTKPLVAGLGAADEPGGSTSFGQSRSRLVAEGIVTAWMAGSQSVTDRMQSIADCFHNAGLSLRTPYLGEGARDIYEWPVEA
jgi:hypothetical protein